MPANNMLPQAEIDKIFSIGKEELKLTNFYEAFEKFNMVVNQSNLDNNNHDLYLSYLGLSRVMLGEINAIDECREIANVPQQRNADICCNLALAEIKLNERNNAIAAIKKSLSYDPHNSRAIAIKRKIDTRRKPTIPFFNRNHSLNILLGKISYKTMAKNRKARINKYSSTLTNFII